MLILYIGYCFLFCHILVTVQAPNKASYIKELFQFPNGSRVENMLALPTGGLLLTLSTEPSLYGFDPIYHRAPVLVRRIPNHTSLLGIAQIDPNTVAVIAGNLTGSVFSKRPGVLGSFSVFLLTLSGEIITSFRIPEATFLKSVVKLPNSPYLLLSDPSQVTVWRLNILTGTRDKISLGSEPFVVNDFHLRGQYLYFLVRGQIIIDEAFLLIVRYLNRIRIKPDGTTVGEPELLALTNPYPLFGNFILKADGSFIVADPAGNEIFESDGYTDRTTQIVNGNDVQNPSVEHPYALALANPSPKRSKILYVATVGYLPEEKTEPFQFYAYNLDTRKNALVRGRIGPLGGSQILKVDLNRVPPRLLPEGFNFHENQTDIVPV